MNKSIEVDAIRRETRLNQLHQRGQWHLKSYMLSLDQIKELLCPDGDETRPTAAQLERACNRANAVLVKAQTPLRLELKRSPFDYQRFVALVTEEEFIDYCEEVNRDEGLDDLLGVRSFYGIFQHYGIRSVALMHTSSLEPLSFIDITSPEYRRRFRCKTPPNSSLRVVIDRVLWGGERIMLAPYLLDAFNAISPCRHRYLTEMGLILMQSDDGEHFEMFVPRPERSVQRQKRVRRLRQIAEAIRERIDRDGVGTLTLDRFSGSEMAKKVFITIAEQRLLDNVTFQHFLADLHLKAVPKTYSSDIPFAIDFIAKDYTPWRGRQVTERDFPVGLYAIVKRAMITTENQEIPPRRDYFDFLQQPEVLDFLRQRNLSVVMPRQFHHLNSEENNAFYIYVENLISMGE